MDKKTLAREFKAIDKTYSDWVKAGRRQMACFIEKKFDEFGARTDNNSLAGFANFLYRTAEKTKGG
jgi:hypothetical protein